MPLLPKLKAARERQALTQVELAEAAGVSRGTVVRIENGHPAEPPTARKLAAALGVKPSELMEDQQHERAA